MQRLPNTPEGETKPIGFRLPPPMLAMIDREVDTLRAASPEGASVTRSTALRALLVELEQRRAADPATPANAPPLALPRVTLERIVAALEGVGADLRGLLEGGAHQSEVADRRREGGSRGEAPPGRRVLHAAPTTAGGQLSLLTSTANDGAEALAGTVGVPSKAIETHRAPPRASTAPNALASAEVLAALKPRLLAAHAAGHSAKAIGRTASVDPACITRWLKGTRAGVSVASAHKLAAYLASIGF